MTARKPLMATDATLRDFMAALIRSPYKDSLAKAAGVTMKGASTVMKGSKEIPFNTWFESLSVAARKKYRAVAVYIDADDMIKSGRDIHNQEDK